MSTLVRLAVLFVLLNLLIYLITWDVFNNSISFQQPANIGISLSISCHTVHCTMCIAFHSRRNIMGRCQSTVCLSVLLIYITAVNLCFEQINDDDDVASIQAGILSSGRVETSIMLDEWISGDWTNQPIKHWETYNLSCIPKIAKYYEWEPLSDVLKCTSPSFINFLVPCFNGFYTFTIFVKYAKKYWFIPTATICHDAHKTGQDICSVKCDLLIL